MRVYLNRSVVNAPWGGGNHWVRAFNELAPSFGAEIIDDPTVADILLAVAYDRDQGRLGFLDLCEIRKLRGRRPKLISRINETSAGKAKMDIDARMLTMIANSDGSVLVSNWLKDYYAIRWPPQIPSWILEKSSVIVNGVDSVMFHKMTPSLLYDRDRLRIVTHHWSDNTMKGSEVYKFLDSLCSKSSSYVFNYIGRTKESFCGINTVVIPPCHGTTLAYELSFPSERRNVYISGAKHEAGPNHILEALSCGLEVWAHSSGGACVEFSGHDHTYTTEEELVDILQKKLSGVDRPNAFVPPEWDTCIWAYVDYMKGLIT